MGRMKDGMDDLFGTPEQPATRLEAAFWVFHEANPGVYRLFCRFTREAIERGRRHFSVCMVIERIRWETMIVTADADFKINNNHRAYYARLWMREHPEHDGFFRTRRVVATGRLNRVGDDGPEAAHHG